ncbi:MAG: hypothetical protein CSA36_07720 [Draconibacterium sp.]|nr:MAG: hypothetical protein CSA36_07720 [Draconibacterium sp.]
MNKITLVFAAVMMAVSGSAQKTADIGIWGGTSGYFGDMDEVPPLEKFNLNLGGYFRYNFNSRIAMRAMFITGRFDADGSVEGYPWAFKKSVQDISLQVEINYLKYILGVKNTPFTPYISGGFGIAFYPYHLMPDSITQFNSRHPVLLSANTDTKKLVLSPTFAFGFGVKYSIGKRLEVGAEYQMRKLFDDKLDDLDDPLSFVDDQGEIVKYTDLIHNNDWSAYLGLQLTYKIYIGKKACPAYESKN